MGVYGYIYICLYKEGLGFRVRLQNLRRLFGVQNYGFGVSRMLLWF